MDTSSLLLLVLLFQASSGCVFCRNAELSIKIRFEKLCNDYMTATGRKNCTDHPGPFNFNPFGLDEESLIFITRKTHRVFRIFEINGDSLGIAAYWDWLHEVKLPQYTHETLCPPLCEKTTTAYNCTRCVTQKMTCWSVKTCYPDTPELWASLCIVCVISATCTLLGLFSFGAEYWMLMKSQPAAPDASSRH